jgi:uncharacterized membrane protein YhaH (DUF805 family)
MEWYLKVINSYFDFNGRARRKEYWMFVLINSIISIVSFYLDNILGTTFAIGYGPIYIGYGLAVLIPSIAVAIRRLHDVGKKWMDVSPCHTSNNWTNLVNYTICYRRRAR